ncbi:MAG: GTP 3',8-cyclase MoaA [Methylocystaceae bacterium]
MQDSMGREISYLRVSVTDRCNLRCLYCMPQDGVELTEHQEILSLEELGRLVYIGSTLGIKRIRITGGEPLVRRGLVKLVENIAANRQIEDLSMTTNGTRLPEMAADLKGAGLQRVNISLDTLNADKYRYITGGGDIDQVLRAVRSSLEIGFNPVKVNVVMIKDFNDDEIDQFVNWAIQEPVHIRFIEFMPIGDLDFWNRSRLIASIDIINRLNTVYKLSPLNNLTGAGPARVYQSEGGQGSIGFITPMSSHFCDTCNRVRLTSQGMLLGCLHGRQGVDFKGPLRQGADDLVLQELFEKAISLKPKGHQMEQGWGKDSTMSQIGG